MIIHYILYYFISCQWFILFIILTSILFTFFIDINLRIINWLIWIYNHFLRPSIASSVLFCGLRFSHSFLHKQPQSNHSFLIFPIWLPQNLTFLTQRLHFLRNILLKLLHLTSFFFSFRWFHCFNLLQILEFLRFYEKFSVLFSELAIESIDFVEEMFFYFWRCFIDCLEVFFFV